MAKKSFMNADNPAMQFISAPAPKPEAAPEAASAPEETAPAATEVQAAASGQAVTDIYFIAPRSAEHKSKRAQLLMTPTLHEKVAKKAASLNMSFNELVNLVLEKYVQ